MKKKEIEEFANRFKVLLKTKHDLDIKSLQDIADVGLEYECGSDEEVCVSKLSADLFEKGLTALVTDEVLKKTDLEIRWDEKTMSPLVETSSGIVNIKYDLVKAYNEGRCRYNIARFFNNITESDGEEVHYEAPLALSEPGVNTGHYSMTVDEIIGKKLEFIEEDVRGVGLYGEGSCVILTIEEMEKIGDLNPINIFNEFEIAENPNLKWYRQGMIHWFAGWLLYVNEGEAFRLTHANQGPAWEYNVIHLSDGYQTYELQELFDQILKNRVDGNPFKVVKLLYNLLIENKNINRQNAWLLARDL